MFGLCTEQLIAIATWVLAGTALVNMGILIVNCIIAKNMVRATREASENMMYLEFRRERAKLIGQTGMLAASIEMVSTWRRSPDVIMNKITEWARAFIETTTGIEEVRETLSELFAVVRRTEEYEIQIIRGDSVTEEDWREIYRQASIVADKLTIILKLLKPTKQGFASWLGEKEKSGENTTEQLTLPPR